MNSNTFAVQWVTGERLCGLVGQNDRAYRGGVDWGGQTEEATDVVDPGGAKYGRRAWIVALIAAASLGTGGSWNSVRA